MRTDIELEEHTSAATIAEILAIAQGGFVVPIINAAFGGNPP